MEHSASQLYRSTTGAHKIDGKSEPTSSADLGIYVHIPFCEQVCPYCDFSVEAVGQLDRELERAYLELLLRELELARADLRERLEGRRLATVYFGGGTPRCCRLPRSSASCALSPKPSRARRRR